MKLPTNYTLIKWMQILGVLALVVLLSLFDGVLPVDSEALNWGFTIGSLVFLAISMISILLYLARAGGLPLPTFLKGSPEGKTRSNTRLLIFSAMIMAIALLLLVIGRLQVI